MALENEKDVFDLFNYMGWIKGAQKSRSSCSVGVLALSLGLPLPKIVGMSLARSSVTAGNTENWLRPNLTNLPDCLTQTVRECS